eukprot:scpid102700/ scgid19406/ 
MVNFVRTFNNSFHPSKLTKVCSCPVLMRALPIWISDVNREIRFDSTSGNLAASTSLGLTSGPSLSSIVIDNAGGLHVHDKTELYWSTNVNGSMLVKSAIVVSVQLYPTLVTVGVPRTSAHPNLTFCLVSVNVMKCAHMLIFFLSVWTVAACRPFRP